MSILTIILCGDQANEMSVLPEGFAKPAIPFGGKYRLIDFPLSNAVNSGLERIAIVIQFYQHTLADYLGNGTRGTWMPAAGKKWW